MQLDELVNEYHRNLNENDLHIWNYISNHRKECEKMAIDQLAFQCNVSRTTILRFAQKLSLKGYSELKLLLKIDNQKSKEKSNDIDTICSSYQSVANNIKDMDCTKLFKRINTARNVFVYGIGMVQSSIKKELKRLFMHVGVMIYDVSGVAEAEYVLNIVDERDLFIMVSITGENETILDMTKKLKVKNVPVLSLTKQKNNSLSQLADYRLFIEEIKGPNTYLDIEYESLTSYFILIEILFMKYDHYKSGQMTGGISCN